MQKVAKFCQKLQMLQIVNLEPFYENVAKNLHNVANCCKLLQNVAEGCSIL